MGLLLTAVVSSAGLARFSSVRFRDPGPSRRRLALFNSRSFSLAVSNVTGEGLSLLKTFLNVVPTSTDGQYPVDGDFEFSVSDVFSVPFVGAVVSGVILSG
jgi:selenocysteine-specific translation elongation factor